MKHSHISYFDFLRGIAIMMVIGIHTYSGGSFDDVAGAVNVIFRQLLNCAVPLFLAMSGFFIARKDLSSKDSYFAFLKKQIPKVYIPCLVWSLPLFALSTRGGVLRCKSSV